MLFRNLVCSLFATMTLCVIGCSQSPNLERLSCAGDLWDDCPEGTFCDPYTRMCGWECHSTPDCAPGMTCNRSSGRCQNVTPNGASVTDNLGLLVEPASNEDLTLRAGSENVELLRFEITNENTSQIEIDGLLVTITSSDATDVAPHLTNTVIMDAYNTLLMGPSDGSMIEFTETVLLQSGERRTFVLRGDLRATAGHFTVRVDFRPDYPGSTFAVFRVGLGSEESRALMIHEVRFLHDLVRNVSVVAD